MSTDLFTRIAEFSSDWTIVIAIGLAFFVTQILLTMRFSFRMRQQQQLLKRLRRNFEQGGGGRCDRHFLDATFPWIQWVHSNFPDTKTGPPGNFTREEVLQELDTQIAGNSDYLLLQRMGVMAPLLGVILTVLGFYWLEVSDEDQSLQSILLTVTPLVSGVGTGAVLALINQVLLHIAGRRAESLRMSARLWFDNVIWRHVGLDTQAATVKAVRALEHFSRSMTETAARHTSVAERIDDSTTSIHRAATDFRDVVLAFSGEIKGVPAALQEVRTATTASAKALDELIHVGARAVANLDVSVAAFRTTLDRDFATAAKLHFRSSNVFAEGVHQIGDAIEQLKSGSTELKQTAQVNADSVLKMDESIRQHLMPGTRQFHESVQALTDQVVALSKISGLLSSSVEATSGHFDHVANRLEPSVRSFCEVVESRFGPAVTQHVGQVELVSSSMQRLQETADALSKTAAGLTAIAQEVSQLFTQERMAQKALVNAAEDFAEAGRGLRQSVESQVAPAQHTMHEVATSMAASTAQLSEFIRQGLGPATKDLAQLHKTLTGLEQIVASIGEFSHARADIDRLTHSLAKAADISDAISALPDQIREIVVQNAQHANVANSHGSLRSWLSKRPK